MPLLRYCGSLHGAVTEFDMLYWKGRRQHDVLQHRCLVICCWQSNNMVVDHNWLSSPGGCDSGVYDGLSFFVSFTGGVSSGHNLCFHSGSGLYPNDVKFMFALSP